jgi:hypothetical protein
MANSVTFSLFFTEADEHTYEDGVRCCPPCAAAAGLLGLRLHAGTEGEDLCPFLDCAECFDTRDSMNGTCRSSRMVLNPICAIRSVISGSPWRQFEHGWSYLGEIFGESRIF